MTFSLQQGQSFSLTQNKPGLKRIMVGLGWDLSSSEGVDFDLDACAFLLGASGRVTADGDFIFYGNMCHSSGSVESHGDNRSGAGDGDDEVITVDLSLIPSYIDHVVFTVTLYDAQARNQNFGMLDHAYVRIIDLETHEELARYDLGQDYLDETSIVVGELCRRMFDWDFHADGTGSKDGLEALCLKYGVNV